MINKEWFVFTTSRKEPEGDLRLPYLISLVILSCIAFVAYFFTPHRIEQWNIDGFVEYSYPTFDERIIFAFAFTFLELVFFLLIPYTLRFAIKPRIKGSSIDDLRDEYDRINRILKKDIILLMQIRIIILLMMILYGALYDLHATQLVDLSPESVRISSNYTTGFLIVVFLIPRYLEKLSVQREFNHAVNYPVMNRSTRDEDILTSFFLITLSFVISWILVFFFLRQVVLTPLGI